MLNRLTSVLAGCAAGIAVIFVMEFISHAIYPLPEGMDPNNPESLKLIMANAPIGALIMVLLAGFLGGFAGGIVAAFVDRNNATKRALAVGIVLTVLGIINLFMIPHPIWFMLINVLVYIGGALLGSLLIKPKKHA